MVMLVVSMQKYSIVQEILEGRYNPSFLESPYACMSAGYTECYRRVLDALSDRTGWEYLYGVESCMWGWVGVPYLPLHGKNWFRRQSNKVYAIFAEIDEKAMVFSDYAKYCASAEGRGTGDFILDRPQGGVVQCSFWRIHPVDVLRVVDCDRLVRGLNVQELYERTKLDDAGYMFDSRMYGLYA